MENAWRIGLFLGLAILGGRDAAEAQTPSVAGAADQPQPAAGAADRPQPAADTADQPQPAPRPTAPATATAGIRRRSDPYFNRVVTTGRGPVAAEARGPADPLKPFSPGVREANARAAMGSTRTPPRAASPPRAVPSSHNYYPGMRPSRHPNANVAQVRRPRRGMGTGVGMGPGMGMGIGAPPAARGTGGVPAGAAGRG
jgi:hypothetical protein